MEWQQWPRLPLAQRERLPSQPGIYVVVDAADQVWYVGLSKNLHARWNGRGHHRYRQLSRTQNKRLYQIHWQFCPLEQLAEREQHYIDQFKPHLNYSKVKTYARKSIQPHQELSRLFKVINHQTMLFPDVRSLVLGYYRELDEDDDSGELKEYTCIVTLVNVNDHDRVILKSYDKSQTRQGIYLKGCWSFFACDCGSQDPDLRPVMLPVFLWQERVYEFVCQVDLLERLKQYPSSVCQVEIAQQPVQALREHTVLLSLLAESSFKRERYLHYRAAELRPVAELLERMG